MNGTTSTCWADPLSRRERAELAAKLARSCHLLFAHGGTPQRVAISEMQELRLDVTERAEVATS